MGPKLVEGHSRELLFFNLDVLRVLDEGVGLRAFHGGLTCRASVLFRALLAGRFCESWHMGFYEKI